MSFKATDIIEFYASDITSDLVVGDMGYDYFVRQTTKARNITACVTDAPTGSSLIADIRKWNGATYVSILSTLITVEAGEFDSLNATTQPVFSDTSLVKGDRLRVYTTQVGSTIKGKCLQISIITDAVL